MSHTVSETDCEYHGACDIARGWTHKLVSVSPFKSIVITVPHVQR